MSLRNRSESYNLSETSQQKTVEGSRIPSKNCDTDSVSNRCSPITGEIKETDDQVKRKMCRFKNQRIKETVDPIENQNRVTELCCSEGLSTEKTAELCLSNEQIPYLQNGEGERDNENSKINYSSVCSKSEGSASVEACEDFNTADSKRMRRSSKRKRDTEDFCPVCGVTVRVSELLNHFTKEVENLSKISKSIKKSRVEENTGINTTFVQVRSNRQNRHAAKVAKFSPRPRQEVRCPVCNLVLTGTQDERNNHVLNCINEDGDDEDEMIVVDDDVSFEEYEFADQTRVRAISMVPGGYRSLHGDSSRSKRTHADDEDLNVDVDDTMSYGNPQYTELDVIHNVTDDTEKKELEQLRKAVLFGPTVERHVLESRKWTNDHDNHASSTDICSLDENRHKESVNHTFSEENNSENIEEHRSHVTEAADHIVSSLKEKIKDLEDQTMSVKCLICLEPYTKPVVSTTCWHVHCEECWLMTMGVKKLCPQCNMIVFPSDLRRIYL